MANSSETRLLGELLRDAHLISDQQLQRALLEKSLGPNQRLGEILVAHGRLKQETADFFAQRWPQLMAESQEQPEQIKPLGHYLMEAGLLAEEQVRELLEEQTQSGLWIRLGARAAMKGWINQHTVDFFIESLYPVYSEDSPFTKPFL